MPQADTSQDAYIATHYYTDSAQVIADHLGWSKSKVMRRILALNLPPKEKQKPDYSVDELVFIAKYKNRLSLEDIAAQLNRPIEGVRKKANRMGLSERKDAYTPEEDQLITTLFQEETYHTIGILLGRTQEGVRSRAKELGLTGNKPRL